MSRIPAALARAWAGARTIRARLTLWYVALLAAILVGFSAFLYVSLDRNLHAELDRALTTEARRVADALEARGGPPLLPRELEDVPAGTVVALYDRTGRLLVANDARQPLPALADALARAGQGQQTFVTTYLPDGTEWRVLTLPVLQRPNRAHTEIGAFRQRLLRQPGLGPVAPEQRAEVETVGLRFPVQIPVQCDDARRKGKGDHDMSPYQERPQTTRSAWPGGRPGAFRASRLALASAKPSTMAATSSAKAWQAVACSPTAAVL